jgi:uroporphyrinogen-III decarboxylase
MVWLHNSEVSVNHVRSHLPLGASIESIGPGGDMAQIRAATRGRQAVSGNLDPLEVLWRGSPATIAREVERLMTVCKEGGGYVFATGEMNPSDVPAENMAAMMQAAKRLSVY